jgi:broad specificity phosphatase PhoE
MPVSKVDIPTFAKAIKEKFPQYKDVNDTDLTKAIIDKHPEYKDRVDLSGGDKPISPVDKGINKTTDKVNQEIQFNGTFQPDLEGEKKGLHINDPDYQKQKADFVGRIYTDQKGNLSYPEQDAKGNWVNYYTKEPIINFDPHEMRGKILQVPHEYLPATGGKKFITPVYNQNTGSYDFPDVQTPDVPHEQTLPEATVYGGKKGAIAKEPAMSPEVGSIASESDRQGGQFRQILKNHPELSADIDNTIKKYGDQYKQSLGTGSEAMTNILQKTVEDKYDLNKPLPENVDPAILNGHLNVLNNFDKNRQDFETNQKELQRQADLITDKAKREGKPVSQEDVDRINQKVQKNISNWNEYTKAVKFAQNYVGQPEVKSYLDEFKKRQSGLQLIDEIRQRSFPSQTAAQIKQDEYDRKAIDGNLNVWDYLKTAVGKGVSGLSNMSETALKMAPGLMTGGLMSLTPEGTSAVERSNNNVQQFIGANLPAISPEGIKEMDKRGMGHLINDLSSTLGGFAPYLIPGMVGEGLGAKAATFATALAESLPNVRKEAEQQGLTGDAYNTFITAKPLVTAAFMTLLPSAKFAKGFDSDIAKAIVDGEFNNPKRFLLNLASKAIKNPGDIAHLQAMLSGTALGENIVNQVTNALQAKDDISKGISRKEGLSVDYSNLINPRQTVVMALAAKIMETVPTLKNTIGDFRAGKEVAETYGHIQNNLVELAAHNLEGVSKEVDKMVRKDPGNVYAQHLKNVIQDFAYAKARMPEGLEPEQEAALFHIQQQISQKQRQYLNADPVYQPHLQKNIEELSKQIPEILKTPQKAIDYLKDAHNDFTESILSPKAKENGKETEANAQTQREGVLEKPEGEVTASEPGGATPSYLVSRHADTKKDEEGKVSGPNQHPLSEAGKKDADDLAQEVAAHAESTGIPVTKIIHSGLERSAQTANTVANKVKAQTISDPGLNTWAIGEFDDIPDEEFKEVQKWFGEHPDERVYDGGIEKFKGKKLDESLNEYAHRTIGAHAKYENEPASTLLIDHSNNMMVMDAYHKNGGQWNEKSVKDYLNAEKPEPASLRTKSNISYPKITNVKIKENAIPIGQRETMGTHSGGDEGVGGSGEGGGVGSGQQGNEPAGEGPQKEEGAGKKGEAGQPIVEPPKPPEDDLPFIEEEGDNEFTSTKNELTRQKVEDAGLEPATKEAARDFGTVWKDAQKKLNKGFDIEGLIKSLGKKPRAVTDLENAMILFHQNVKESQLDAASKELGQARKENDRDKWNEAYGNRARLLDDLQNIYNVDKAIGRETARGLNARKMMADRRFSLVNMQLEKRASAGGEPLTDEQTAKVQKQYEDIKSAKEALDTRVEELQKENAKLKAEKTVQGQSKTTGRARKTKEQYVQDRKDIVQKMREDLLKAAKGGEGLTSSIPLAAQLKAVAPHIKKLVDSFIEQGIDKLEDITKGIHDLLKPSIPELEERHVHDLIAGEFNEPKQTAAPTPSKAKQIKEEAKVQKYRATDPKLMKLQADYEKAKEKFEQDLKRDQLKTRTGFQKIQDAFLKYERFAKLSNPITLGKLSMAALTRLSTTPIEEGVGAFYSTLLPGLAKMAPGEAGFHVNALAKGYKATFMRGLDDAATVAKGGKTDIEAVYGKKGHLPPEAIDFFGQLHSAIKAPVKRFAFERSFEKRMANNIKAGTPIDGMVEARIAMEAYKDANRAIFMQDNAVSRGWSMLISGLERTDTPGAKELATGLQWLIPFVKVPTNIVGETISHVAGPELALAKILHTGLTKGLGNLSQDEAENIMRNLKKGTIGHGALILGYLNPASFGGYYQEKEKRDPNDVKFGGAKLFGHKIPAWMLEAPIFQAMQLGATVRRVKDKLVKGEPKGLGEGVWAGALGLLEHEPLIDEPVRLGKMLGTSNERQYFLGELAKSTLVPAVSDYAAKVTDPLDERPLGERLMEPENKRRPAGEGLEGIKEHVESAIPGLRENVGEKKPTSHKQRQHKPSM